MVLDFCLENKVIYYILKETIQKDFSYKLKCVYINRSTLLTRMIYFSPIVTLLIYNNKTLFWLLFLL